MLETLLLLSLFALLGVNIQMFVLTAKFEALNSRNLDENKPQKAIDTPLERLTGQYKPRVVRRSDDVLWQEEQARKG